MRFLTEDPAKLVSLSPDCPVPGDAIPEPAPGEVNWALAANGSRATASSQEAHGLGSEGHAAWPASGAIDGRRDDAGWGAGHGWVSKAGEPLSQWLEVDFGQERAVQRFVVITYQKEKQRGDRGQVGRAGLRHRGLGYPEATMEARGPAGLRVSREGARP